MGQKIVKQSNSETINWDNIKTEDVQVSSNNKTQHHNNISSAMNTLVNNLKMSETESDYNDNVLEQVLNTHNTHNINDSELSATSPFISSDVYKNMNKDHSTTSDIANVQQGGKKSKSKKSKKRSMKNIMDDSSSDISSTASSSSDSTFVSSDSSDVKKHPKKKEQKKKTSQRASKTKKTSKRSHRGHNEDLSYNSSSAHTGGEFSDSVNNASVTNENNATNAGNVSINTSDINMVSDY